MEALNYSTNIEDAWLVVEKMIKDGSAFGLSGGGLEKQWCACFKSTTEWADTAPHDICLASLKALETK